MQQFQLFLKNEKLVLYNRLSWFIIIILTAVFSYLNFFSDDQLSGGKKFGLIILIALAFILKFYFQKTRYQIGNAIFFYLLLLAFISREQYVLAIITLFFELLNTIATRKTVANFSSDYINFPSFPPKRIKWDTLNNIILKDGLLTIDFKNNKIIQQMIDEQKTIVDEQEFNDFCRQQLRSN
ncbi:MAG TPA: hypothetical protein VFV31_09270 [Chitinophagaceae bacterium]|nr:hypothetical protein [Chitinophagaceae bacterium]